MGTTQNEWFEGWFDSPYYHLLYKDRSREEASQFVHKIAAELQAEPGDKVLDLACGKGRHAVAFAQLGLDVSAVDLSKESIAYAKQFEHEKLHFFVHDMREIFRTEYFDFVCNLFTSFGYFASPHDNVSAAQSIFAALKKGGKFLIDFVNRNHAVRNIEQNRNETLVIENIEFSIERSYSDRKFIKDIHIADGEKKMDFQESVNSFTAAEMTDLFQAAGLTFIRQFGNYELEAYNEQNSPRMIMLFQK